MADDDVEMLIETCQAFIAYHVLPYPGGWMNQPIWWTHWLQSVYVPGINRARYDALKSEDKKNWHFPPTKVEVPPDMEW